MQKDEISDTLIDASPDDLAAHVITTVDFLRVWEEKLHLLWCVFVGFFLFAFVDEEKKSFDERG